MLGRLARLLVAATELLEAEGRALRMSVFATAAAVALVALAAALGLLGVTMLVLAVFWGLDAVLGRPGAAGVSGALAMAGGLAVLAVAARTVRAGTTPGRRRAPPARPDEEAP